MTFWSKPLIFVSYSRKDQQAVDSFVQYLGSKRFRIWLDRRSIGGGEWKTQIKQGLRKSNFFLACLSPNTKNPGEVLQFEFDTALEIQRERLEGDNYLLPIRLEPCDLPDSLKHLECFDLYEPARRQRLLEVLQSKSQFRTAFAASLLSIAILVALVVYLRLRTPPEQAAFKESRAFDKASTPARTVSLGVTLWKMQPSIQSDPMSVREIVHPDPGGSDRKATEEWTPVRLSAGEEFRLGDNFQIGIETSRRGYLYVINRELRDNGGMGMAKMIFPTARIRDGSADVLPGRIVRLPDRTANPPYWRFESRRHDYAGELLIFVFSGQPVEQLEHGESSDPTVDELIRKYGRDVLSKVFNGRGIRLTSEEAAARDQGAHLTSTAPLPPVVFQTERDATSPVAVEFPLRVVRK